MKKTIKMNERELQYPNILYFVIDNLNYNSLEFDANIKNGDIIKGYFIGTDTYETDDGEHVEYGNYQTREIPDYPLMVELDEIDNNQIYYAHQSFGYYIYSKNNIKNKQHKKMIKNKIQLTETQLHNIIKESVNMVLNEIKIGGEELHGNNATDWATLARLRHNAYMDAFNHNDDDAISKHIYNMQRDNRNAYDVATDDDNENVNEPGMPPYPKYQRNAIDKTNRILNNLGLNNESIIREAVNRTLRKYIR